MIRAIKPEGLCCYCNQIVNINNDDNFYVKTRRKTVMYFHGVCYRRYLKIGFNPTEVN